MCRELKIKTEQDKLIEGMAWLLNLTELEKQCVTLTMRKFGVRELFENIEELELSYEAKYMMKNLRTVILTFEDEQVLEQKEGADHE